MHVKYRIKNFECAGLIRNYDFVSENMFKVTNHTYFVFEDEDDTDRNASLKRIFEYVVQAANEKNSKFSKDERIVINNFELLNADDLRNNSVLGSKINMDTEEGSTDLVLVHTLKILMEAQSDDELSMVKSLFRNKDLGK
uniref:Uncharacterized protein n=1 Tax=Euplotes harpa TaxID=151035 RepID=A0A7S3JJ12_9SPIT|mmetsp:Transcript_40158/g.46063  ORF Transcript_40158/g.46063 Transcript_40158/m.46063 type:complete len:140 (+) Transcript_40158:72-491(+)